MTKNRGRSGGPKRGAGLLTPRSGLAALLGFGSALPFVFLTGTLGVWIAELGASMAAIGMLSWITLGYGFKLLWAPFVRNRLLVWIAACQIGLAAAFLGLAVVDPSVSLPAFVSIATAGALISATQDIAFEAWRIRIADQRTPVEVVMTASQLGARAAGMIGGAAALALSAPFGWSGVALLMALVSMVLASITLLGERIFMLEPERVFHRTSSELSYPRLIALGMVMACFAIAFTICTWHALSSMTALGSSLPDAYDFTLTRGPLIVFMIAIAPILASQIEGLLLRSGSPAAENFARSGRSVPPVIAELYETLVAPFGDLALRYGWRLVLLLLFISIYSVSWYSWAGFTMPLYINTLGYTKNEVAVAARLFGSAVTALGILAGGMALLRLRRFHALLLGALLPVIANTIYGDLANGGRFLGATVELFGGTAQKSGSLGTLYLAIGIKSLVVGTASAIFAGHLATIVSPKFAAVQCAIISSLVFTFGTLLSALTGELVDRHGFAAVTEMASLVALFAALVVILCEYSGLRYAPLRDSKTAAPEPVSQ